MAESLKRCESCHENINQCATIYCQSCDESFDKALINCHGDSLFCPKCSSTKVVQVPDDTDVLCKYCWHVLMVDLPTDEKLTQSLKKSDSPEPHQLVDSLQRSQSLPVKPSIDHAANGASLLSAWCRRCKVQFAITDPAALCACGDEADSFLETQPIIAEAGDSSDRPVVNSESDDPGQPCWTKNYPSELWRFIGCVCHNNEPDCFDLQTSQSATESFHCETCKLPFGRAVFDQEIPRDKCPRCGGKQVQSDRIAPQDQMVVCLHCDTKLSKRYLDSYCSEVQTDVQNEFQDGPPMHNLAADCGSCGKAKVLIEIAWHNGSLWLCEACEACGVRQPRFEIDAGPALRDMPPEQTACRPQEEPDEFIELACHCCGIGKLHPVAEDPEDNLLTCSCGSTAGVICLAECTHPRIPKTVSELRRALSGSFSSGALGEPSQIRKVASAAQLKPGDHLQFERILYSHHAIVVDVLPDERTVAMIEYTGELDAKTVKAAASSALKGRIERTRMPFADVEANARLLEYRSLDCLSPKVVIERAVSRMGEEGYHLGKQNCEHFCNWAKTGLSVSRQVDLFKDRAKKVLESNMVDAVLDKIAQLGAGHKSVAIGVDILRDLRSDLLKVANLKHGASDQVLPSMLRLGIKWGIRGLPWLFSLLFLRGKGLLMLPVLDKGMKPFGEFLADRILPVKDQDDIAKSDNKKA